MNNFKIGEQVKLKDGELGIVLGKVPCGNRPYLEVWTGQLEGWFVDEVEKTGKVVDSINLKGEG